MEVQGKRRVDFTKTQYREFSFPTKQGIGGGSLVMSTLLAREVDTILDLESLRPEDIVTELAVAATYSHNGKLAEKGNKGLQWWNGLNAKRREFIVSAYNAMNNTSPQLDKALIRTQVVDADTHRFLIPGTELMHPETKDPIPGTEIAMVFKELTAGQIDDVLRAAVAGAGATKSLNALMVNSLMEFDGMPSPKGVGALKWLGGLQNIARTWIAVAYQHIHVARRSEVVPFLQSGGEMLDAPPKAI